MRPIFVQMGPIDVVDAGFAAPFLVREGMPSPDL